MPSLSTLSLLNFLREEIGANRHLLLTPSVLHIVVTREKLSDNWAFLTLSIRRGTEAMQKLGDFKLPHFFNYPPYFTLQPVRDIREKQVQLWKELILEYCRSQKIFVIGLEEEFPLFSNPAIERSLSHEAREAFLSALVSEGRAEWIDKGHRKCLILWHRIQEWAGIILNFVKDNGLEDSVMTVEEIRSGIESRGTDLHGVNRTILMRALKLLEQKGKLALFKGSSADDEGVKFSI